MTAARLYTTPEAAERLSVSPTFLKRAAAARTLPHTRVGRFVRWSEDDLEQIVALGACRPVVSPIRRRRSA